MRVAVWNMGHWSHREAHEEAWRWLLGELAPDIALLQECVPPPWVQAEREVLFQRAYPHGRQPWGTALVAEGLRTRPAELPEVQQWFDTLGEDPSRKCVAARLAGWCVAAHVDLPGLPGALVISLHNPAYHIDPHLLVGRDLAGIKLKLSKDVWLLDVLFSFLKTRLPSPLLIGGDFNYSRLLDEPKPRGNAEFFDRIAAEGFVSLHRLFHEGDQQTFFHPRRRRHQLDYLYASSSVAGLAKSCHMVSFATIERFSDHVPIVAEFAT